MLKKLILALAFVCFVAKLCWGAEEIIFERTYNQKVYDLGKGQQNYKIHTAQIHYKDGSEFKDIDTNLTQNITTKQWKQSKASYHCKIPEYSDDWFEFYNAYEGANHTIKAKPICEHIKGTYFKGEDGNGVIYKGAFGKGIDLKVYAYWAGLKKVIVINEKPADTSKDLTFDFELDLGSKKVKDHQGNEWNKQSALNFKDKTLKIGDAGKESYFRNAMVWDSKGLCQPVDIELFVQGGKTYLRKTIKAEILEKAVYPLYTDHPTSYYAGAGDGRVSYNAANWDATHDAAVGNSVSTSFATEYVYTSTNNIYRVFIPIDTSGIDDGVSISAASLYFYPTTKYDTNETQSFIALVQTSQADPTGLITDDFDQCGAIDNPTRGASDMDLGSITTNQYNYFVLNATGLSWIDKINTSGTLLGIRTGFDTDDVVASGGNGIAVVMSEDTSGTKDPYLDVTTGGGVTYYLGRSKGVGIGVGIGAN
jgi:hypothetical protein